METKEQNIHNTRLRRVKKLLIPVVVLGLTLVFLIRPELQLAWGGLQEFTTLSHTLQVQFFVLVGGGGGGLILLVELVGRVKSKHLHLKIQKITFTTTLRQGNFLVFF